MTTTPRGPLLKHIIEQSRQIIDTVTKNTEVLPEKCVLAFLGPFSVVLMDKGFDFTVQMVKEVKAFVKQQGITEPIARLSVVNTYSTLLEDNPDNDINNTSDSFSKLIVAHGADGKLEAFLDCGSQIESRENT